MRGEYRPTPPERKSGWGTLAILVGLGAVIFVSSPGGRHLLQHGHLPRAGR